MSVSELFKAKSIAVIGASHEIHKVGHDIFRNLLASKKKIFPINPNVKEILGVKTYPSVLDVKDEIDLAIIVVPAKIVPVVMKDCVKKGIKFVIIISAGFSEVGNKALEEEVLGIAKNAGIRILGPNCLGVIDPAQKFNATFFNKMPVRGKISFVSQSGALGVAELDWAIKKKIGLSKFISVGNIIDIDFAELINYLNEDKKTKVICLYVESLKNGTAFIEAAKKSLKPIIVLKAGTTSSGLKAAVSHTGALATDNAIYDGVFRQCRVSRVNTLYQLFEVAQAHVFGDCPKGKRALIITNAGGPGVIASDAFEKNDVEIASLPNTVLEELNKKLPLPWSHNNPVDVIGDALPERYEAVLKTVEKEKFYDFVFLILTPQTMTGPEKVAEILVEFHKRTKVPCFGCFMGGKSVDKAKSILNKNHILNFEEPEYGALVIGKTEKCLRCH
jgi:acetyl coenzyme A synthetase (ADP forming)-like protein